MKWYQFLSVIAQLVGGDAGKLLMLGAAAGRAGAAGKQALAEATAKAQQLVDEKRGLTPEENAALDASIEEKLAAAAAVELPDSD